MSDRISSMYGVTYDDDIVSDTNTSSSIPTIVDTVPVIELQKNIAIIRTGDKTVSVPTIAHTHEMLSEITLLKRQLKSLANENRRMRIFMNSMSTTITKMNNLLDNKMDKF